MRRQILIFCAFLMVSLINVINCYGTSTFGTGLDGNLTVSSTMIVNTQNTNLSQSANIGGSVIHVADASLYNVNDNILVIQMLGGETGVYDDVYIQAVDTGLNQLLLENPLQNSYLVSADALVQVLRIPNYDSVTINPTGAITCNNWNNTTGGIIAFKVLNTLTNNGVITASGKGSFGSTGGAGGMGGTGGSSATIDGGFGVGSGYGGNGANSGQMNAGPAGPHGGTGGAYGNSGFSGAAFTSISYPGFYESINVNSTNLSDSTHILFGASGKGGTGGFGGRGAGSGGGSYSGYAWYPTIVWNSLHPGQVGNVGGSGGNGGNGGFGGGIVYIEASYIYGNGSFESKGSNGANGSSGIQGGAGGSGSQGYIYDPGGGWGCSGAGGGGNGGNGGDGGNAGDGGAGGSIVINSRFLDGSIAFSIIGGFTGLPGNGGGAGLGGTPGTPAYAGSAGASGAMGIQGSSGLSGLSGLSGFIDVNSYMNFNAVSTSGQVPLMVNYVPSNVNISSTTFYWDFDNNGVVDSTEPYPQYMYTQPGVYSVKLVVHEGAQVDSLLKENYISVTMPNDPRIAVTPDTLSYGNVSLNSMASKSISIQNWGATNLEIYSISPTNSKYHVSLPPELSYPLIVPSLTNFTVDITFTPTAVQLYQANLMILSNDTDNNLITKQLIGYGYILGSDFTASPQSGDIPLEVQFTSTSQGDIVSYLWDFGDGQTSNEVNPVHIYSQKGLYNVTLTIQDQYTTLSRTEDGFIQAIAHPILTSPNSNTPLSFGIVYLGDAGSRQLILESTGSDSVYIHNLSFYESNTAYSVVPGSIPEYLLPGEQVLLDLTFNPSQSNAYRDTLYIINSSENIPLMKIRLDGIGEYVPPQVPQGVSIYIDGFDSVISWEPVTQNIYNTPITVPYYFIYGSVVPDPDASQQVFLGYSAGNTFRHLGVGLPGSNVNSPREFFYSVTAVVWYPPRDGNIILDKLIGFSKEELLRKLFIR